MSFLHPGVLWALLLGAVPILIYYLMRFRSQRCGWGAEYILQRALARLRRRLYWDQLLLLALRALAMLALALAFARPLLRGAAAAVGGAGARRIVIVDATASMQAGEPGHTRWERASEALHELVGLWGRGGEWSLLELDDAPRWRFRQRAVESPADSRAALAELRPGEGAGSMAAALTEALALDDGRPLEIYLFGDDQASAWRDAAESLSDRPLAHVRFHRFCPPLPQRRNLGVTAVGLSHGRVLRGHPFAFTAEIANLSDAPAADAEVTFLLDGAPVGAERVSLQPWQRIRVRGHASATSAGAHALTVRLGQDALALDNRAAAGFEAAERLAVAVLTDPGRTNRLASACGFLQQAAGVFAGTEWSGGAFEVTGVDAAAAAGLSAYDAVVLDGGSALTPDLADRLAAFVQAGGSLIAAADDTVDAHAWNSLLEPRGLLPARLGPFTAAALGSERFRRLGTPWYGGAPGAAVAAPDRGFTHIRFHGWRQLTPLPGSDVRHVFDDQSPYHVEKRFARGSVQLLAAGLAGRDNALFVREATFPYLVGLFCGAAARAQFDLTVRRGEPVRVFAGGGEPVSGAQVIDASGTTVAVQPVARDGGWELAAPVPTRASGLASMLVLRGAAHDRVWVGVQGDCADSDLTPVDAPTADALAARTGWTESAKTEELVEAVRRGAGGREGYSWVMAACLACLLGELAAGLRFV